ncbi:MAG: magnesium transporter [Proteobacteria bacterium]|nr:magnesium transporter [Pseudomonadota bacterium]
MSEVEETEGSPDYDLLEETLKEAIALDNVQQAEDIVGYMSNQEALRQVSRLGSDDREQLISILQPETVAELVEDAPAELAMTFMEGLETSVAVKIMAELHSDTQADLMQEMGEEQAEAILSAMDAESAEDVRKLSQHEPDSAGGLMELEAFTFNKEDTVGGLLSRFVQEDEEFERHRGQHPYILDDAGKLVGVVSLRDLLRNKRSTVLQEIMHEPIAVSVDTSQEALISLFDEHPFLGIPVVDGDGSLLGVVSRLEVAEAELERAEHESLSRQQVGDELRTMPLLLRSRRRLVWLSSNIVLNIVAASVIAAYEDTLTAVIAIAIFLPMVSDMSGCSGNQAVGVSMRELALGLTRPVDLFHVLKKELGVGIINGITLGILIGVVVFIWQDNFFLGIVIGLALAINTLIAVSIGGTIPLLLKRFGVDPAVASGPLLTTVTDMAGFFLVLSLATLFMPQLIA